MDLLEKRTGRFFDFSQSRMRRLNLRPSLEERSALQIGEGKTCAAIVEQETEVLELRKSNPGQKRASACGGGETISNYVKNKWSPVNCFCQPIIE